MFSHHFLFHRPFLPRQHCSHDQQHRKYNRCEDSFFQIFGEHAGYIANQCRTAGAAEVTAEESRNEFRQKYHSMGLKEKENCTEQLKEFMKAMQQKGPKVIIATLGKNGSIGYDGNSWYRFGIIECKVVDTMGAGDSFIAGFLYGILNGLNVQDSMEAGAQNSAITIGYQGAW